MDYSSLTQELSSVTCDYRGAADTCAGKVGEATLNTRHCLLVPAKLRILGHHCFNRVHTVLVLRHEYTPEVVSDALFAIAELAFPKAMKKQQSMTQKPANATPFHPFIPQIPCSRQPSPIACKQLLTCHRDPSCTSAPFRIQHLSRLLALGSLLGLGTTDLGLWGSLDWALGLADGGGTSNGLSTEI